MATIEEDERVHSESEEEEEDVDQSEEEECEEQSGEESEEDLEQSGEDSQNEAGSSDEIAGEEDVKKVSEVEAGEDDLEDLDEMKERLASNEEFRKREEKKGVAYIERVPPFMQVDKIRHIFSSFGKVGRIYLTPEDKSDHRRRVKRGGQKRTKFIDGWVEFDDKKAAKHAANILNCQVLGGKKRHNFWRDDIWSVRYLPKFKWLNLMEHRHYVKQVRKAKLEQRMAMARKENMHYVEQVERRNNRQKKHNAITSKREKRAAAEQSGGANKKPKGMQAVLANLVG